MKFNVHTIWALCQNRSYWFTWFSDSCCVFGSNSKLILWHFYQISSCEHSLCQCLFVGLGPPSGGGLAALHNVACDWGTTVLIWDLPGQSDTGLVDLSGLQISGSSWYVYKQEIVTNRNRELLVSELPTSILSGLILSLLLKHLLTIRAFCNCSSVNFSRFSSAHVILSWHPEEVFVALN